MRTCLGLAPVALCLLVARDGRAAGVALDAVQSARATAMGGAVTAIADDASAVFYNPAGIAQGRIFEAEIGDSLIVPSFTFTSPQGASTHNTVRLVPPFQVYESGGITDDLSIGIGVFTPYGLTLAWPPGWVGKSLITEAALATYDINPTVAYRFGPLRIGAGLQLVRATVDLKRDIETGTAETSTELGAATWGVGGNVGVQLEAIPKYVLLGAHYRSAVTLAFDGEAHFDDVPAPLQGTLHDQRATTRLITPDTLQLGVASHVTAGLVLELDAVWYGWSKFRSIDVNFPNDASGSLRSTEPKNWHDTVNVHLGGEQVIDAWRVRAGLIYDPSPAPADTLTPDLPDADRVNVSVGGGYVHPSGVYIDVGDQLVFLLKRTSTAPQLPGDYSAVIDVLGVSVGYRTPSSPSRAAATR